MYRRIFAFAAILPGLLVTDGFAKTISIQASRIAQPDKRGQVECNLYLPEARDYSLSEMAVKDAEVSDTAYADSRLLDVLTAFEAKTIRREGELSVINGPLGPLDLSYSENWFEVDLPDSNAAACVDSIQKLPLFWAEEGMPGVEFCTNDPYWGIQSAYLGSGSGPNRLNLPAAWEFTTGDPTVVVGVIDSGKNRDHQDFQGVNFIGESGYTLPHGQSVCSVIGAKTGNGKFMAGIADVTISMRRVDCLGCISPWQEL